MDTAETFHVETVETTHAPSFAAPGRWCRYVLASECSRIVGRYNGTLSQTRRNAEQLAKRLNDRRRTGKSVWMPRAQKGAKAKGASPQARHH